MKSNNETNLSRIDWKNYKEELESRETQALFNECERDLHTMTVKEGSVKKHLLSPTYGKIVNQMSIFDQTNLDYFNYEKELSFGEFSD